MTNKVKADEPKQVSFSLIEVEKIRFFENDPEEIGFKGAIVNEVNTGINTQLKFNFDKETIGIILEVDFKLKENSDISLFGIKTKHIYLIKDIFKVVTKLNNNEVNIPPHFIASLISIAYSGTRGMLSVLVSNEKYKKIILPIVDPIKLLPKQPEK